MEAAPTAEVYLRQGHFLVAPQHRTQYGFRLSGEPVWEVAESEDDGALGVAVLSALESSQTDFFFDRADRNKWPPVQQAAKARSWTQFIKGTKEVVVSRSPDGALHIHGLSESVDQPNAVTASAPTATADADLGRLVRQVAEAAPAHSGRKPYT